MAPRYKVTLLNLVLTDTFSIYGLDVCKNHVIIFGSFLDIQKNADWLRLFWLTRYSSLVLQPHKRFSLIAMKNQTKITVL